MTEKRIREIAAKMWKSATLNGPKFDQLPTITQSGWIAAARIAVQEVQGGKKVRKPKPAFCAIDKHGKRTCK